MKTSIEVKVYLKRLSGVLALLLLLPITPIIMLILGLIKVSQGS